MVVSSPSLSRVSLRFTRADSSASRSSPAIVTLVARGVSEDLVARPSQLRDQRLLRVHGRHSELLFLSRLLCLSIELLLPLVQLVLSLVCEPFALVGYLVSDIGVSVAFGGYVVTLMSDEVPLLSVPLLGCSSFSSISHSAPYRQLAGDSRSRRRGASRLRGNGWSAPATRISGARPRNSWGSLRVTPSVTGPLGVVLRQLARVASQWAPLITGLGMARPFPSCPVRIEAPFPAG